MKPFKIYAEHLEATALEQFESAMAQPSVVQGALMPDAHTGYSLPIGAVVATKGMIFPQWVGYDIGCGMCAVPTTFDAGEIRANAKAIFDQIYRDVPVAHNHNKVPSTWVEGDALWRTPVADEIFRKGGLNQLGTLGGGNHFIEVGVDEHDTVWIITHSGSRNLGHKIATHYMKLASPNGKAAEGHYGFEADSTLGRQYVDDLNFALAFALENRKQIIQRTADAISKALGTGQNDHIGGLINRNHNHAELKNGLWIHRKGATHAEDGMLGVIPGNMRDGSFIVRGKGNPDSLFSSSHGAGRVMGRKVAQGTLSINIFKEQMRGVQAKVDIETLDESPSAYKDIHEVMALQRDLVEVLHHVKPIINIKG